jgi:hypothetical protein
MPFPAQDLRYRWYILLGNPYAELRLGWAARGGHASPMITGGLPRRIVSNIRIEEAPYPRGHNTKLLFTISWQ